MHRLLYPQLLSLAEQPAQVSKVILGLNWTLAEVSIEGAKSVGLSFSPQDAPRILTWPGTLVGKNAAELAPWLKHWDPCEAAVGAAVTNAVINHRSLSLSQAQLLPAVPHIPPHLAVFSHFAPSVQGAKVVVIGSYPGLEASGLLGDFTCIERRVRPGDLPDTAAEFILPEADWVFITASSIANKTLPRLLALAAQARVVLMGPSVPWLANWQDYGVDYVAGVTIKDADALTQTLMEGGGTRIFSPGVGYCVYATGRLRDQS
jgi:uncharacterized protein (DUF4213/DUF364 family)